MAKLVEILARELKEWHPAWHALSQAKDGSLYCRSLAVGYTNFSLTLAHDHRVAIVTRAEWQAAVDALYPKLLVAEEWDGIGLPPIGVDIEYFTVDRGEYWCAGSVSYIGPKFIVVTYDHPEFGQSEACMNHAVNDGTLSSRIRPIRTPEQIAADERRKGIADIAEDLGKRTWGVTIQEWLYDLGYRKQEQK